jgi:hypothetical protein
MKGISPNTLFRSTTKNKDKGSSKSVEEEDGVKIAANSFPTLDTSEEINFKLRPESTQYSRGREPITKTEETQFKGRDAMAWGSKVANKLFIN